LNSTQYGEVLVLGDINIDTVWPVPVLPGPGRDAYVQSVSTGLGGATLNTAIVLDRLGQPAAVFSCLGNDLFAGLARAMIAQTGVNQEYICVNPLHGTGLIFLAVTPDGERTMFSFRGANVQLDPAAIREEAFEHASILHISGYSLLEHPQSDAVWRAVELAKKHQVAISLDTGLEPALIDPQGLCRLLDDVDICVTGLKETGELFCIADPELAAAHLISLGVKLAAIKLGEKGCFIASQEGKYSCPAFKVDVVDTTGAGDAFTAGLLYAWLRKWDLPSATILSSALGAIATTVKGAGLELPTHESVLKFLESKRDESVLREDIDRVIAALQ
jgi:ribokinase